MNLVLVSLLLGLSILSGMLGIGVAFAAVPFLSLYLPDLVNQVQPLSLLLNGITALFSLVGFAQAGYVDWRRGGILALATTLSAPIGSYLALWVSPALIWAVYFVSVLYLCWRLMRPHIHQPGKDNFRLGVLLAVPISIATGFLGVGPGFLLMPALMLVGFNARSAAGMNALAVTPSSFSAVLPHWSQMRLDFGMDIPLIVAGALGSLIGARLATRQIPEVFLRKILLAVILVATFYRMIRLFL